MHAISCVFLLLTSDHQNFFGIDDNLGPVAVSLRKEKLDDSPPFTLISPLASPKSQCRFIVRTSEVSVVHVLSLCGRMCSSFISVSASIFLLYGNVLSYVQRRNHCVSCTHCHAALLLAGRQLHNYLKWV